MKKIKIFILTFISQFVFSQIGNVGINTTNPTKTLDVVGDARIRKIDSLTATPKYILVPDSDGVLKKINTDKLSSGSPSLTAKKIFALIPKSSKQLLAVRGADYNLVYDGTISGINTDKIQLNSDKNRIILPPNKTFKITGYIGISNSASGSGNNGYPGYITSSFISGGNATTIVSTLGYTESSTEAFDDGGVANPIIIVTTGDTNNNYVELQVRYGGSQAGTSGYYVSGAPSKTSLGTYILLEEM